MIALGLDTSNYTTSAAWFDGTVGENRGRLLTVRSGELGLRQSEALFQHVQRLPELVSALVETFPDGTIAAVGASERPRSREGSYMPCFTAGMSLGRAGAAMLKAPYHGFSHQEGHLAAILWSSGHLDWMEQPLLAWHLSGGTTELLYVRPGLQAEIIGGTEDLSAGQLIDRTGQKLGLDFPAGRALDTLALRGEAKPFPVKVRGMRFSLSGMENRAAAMVQAGAKPEDTAAFTIGCIVSAVARATEQARQSYGDLPVLFSGGVSSSVCLRREMVPLGGVFGAPEYSTDNAMGIAVLTWLAEKRDGNG